MNQLRKGIASALALSLFGLVATVHAQRAVAVDNSLRSSDGSDGMRVGAVNVDNVPMVDWVPAQKITRRVARDGQKASTDIVSVYRPLPLCRLMDTRVGQPSALGTNGGLLIANNGRVITPATACGIPTSNVSALSISFVTQNTTVNNGGYLTFIPTPASPVSGTNLVFNTGSVWAGTTANVNTDFNGSFVAFVAQSSVQLIIDVNGYYQDLNSVDTDTELDITGAVTGDLLEITNSGTGNAFTVNNTTVGGTAVRVSGSNQNSTALRVTGGKLAVSGVASGSTTTSGSFVFTHTVTAGSINAICLARSNIDHPMLNGVPNARLIVTPYNEFGTGVTTITPPGVLAAEYVGAGNSCAANQHRLFFDANAVVGARYTVMVISP